MAAVSDPAVSTLTGNWQLKTGNYSITMLLICSPRFEEHVTPPGHPERPERAHVFDSVAQPLGATAGRTAAPRAGDARRARARPHAGYLDADRAHAGRPSMLDADTFTSPESYEIARLAAGAAVQAAEHALEQRRAGVRAGASARPPRRARRAMGFCLFNNVAVAAAAALRPRPRARRDRRHRRAPRQRHAVDLLRRSARAVRLDAPVPVLSGHRRRRRDRHAATGAGFTVNVPLEAGATDADYALVYRDARRAGARAVRAGADARVGRLRRARARSAGVDADDVGRLRRDRRADCAAARAGTARSRWSPKAATTSRRCATCLEASFAAIADPATSARDARASAASRRAGRRRRAANARRQRRSARPLKPLLAWDYNLIRSCPTTSPRQSRRSGRNGGARRAPSRSPRIRPSRSSTASRCSRTRRGTRTSATSATT